MGAEAIAVGPKRRWGTWEELILGGAVLRHGTQDWNVVASELRARTLCPFYFTPEVCKTKYEDLRKRYSGCSGWFEELRRQRVAELRRELERSEDSIGSLESKIESLKTERQRSNQFYCGSSHTESPVPLVRSDGNESFGKEISKDGLSAGSFTQDTRINWSPEGQTPAVGSALRTSPKHSVSQLCGGERDLGINEPTEAGNLQGGTPRKRRGKRKRKVCKIDVKEGSIGESDNLGSTDVLSNSRCKETSTSDCGQPTGFSSRDNRNASSCEIRSDNLMGIFDSVSENKVALVFRHRLDGQKRARYKKIIKQHVDFNLIRSRIASCSIKTERELFRDLLLLANNALVFYSKRTREYKSAMALRDIVLKEYRQYLRVKGSCSTATSACLPMPSLYNPPVKPRSARPRPSKQTIPVKLHDAEGVIIGGFPKKRDPDANIPLQSLLVTKKGVVKHVAKIQSGFSEGKGGGGGGLKRPAGVRNGLVRSQAKSPGLKHRKGGGAR